MTETRPARACRGAQIAAAALALCGVRFRFQGSDPVTGLDCVGLVAVCMRKAGLTVNLPRGYGWRSGSLELIDGALTSAGMARLTPSARGIDGDIVLVQPGRVQWHLLIRTGSGHVHAHAGLRKVVLHPGAAPWPICACFRAGEK